MIPASVLIIILIGGVLFDLDAWGIALALLFCGTAAWFLH